MRQEFQWDILGSERCITGKKEWANSPKIYTVQTTRKWQFRICKYSNVRDSKVFGYDVPTLNFRFKITGDTTKEKRFYFWFFLLVCKRRKESGTISTYVNLVSVGKSRKLEMARKTLEDLEDNIWYRPKCRNTARQIVHYWRNIANPSVLLCIRITASLQF